MSGPGQQPVQQVERCGVDPLQVVEEDDQRMRRLARGARRNAERRNRNRLRASVGSSGGGGACRPRISSISGITSASTPPFAPSASDRRARHGRQTVFALGQQLPHQAAERLRQRTVRNVADDLIELARR